MTCYLRNGTQAKRALPCGLTAISEGKHTSCCDPGDLCLTNGLCRDPAGNDSTNFAWFFGCTDKTFRDPSCGTYCDKVNKGNNHLMFKCPQVETWCCNTGAPSPNADRINRTNTTCCSMEELLFKASEPSVYATALYSGVPLSTGTLLSPSTAATLSRYLAKASTVPSAEARTSPAEPVDQGSAVTVPQSNSPSLRVGLGAGLGALATIALVIGAFVLWRRRKTTQHLPSELPSDDRVELTGQDIVEAMDGKERFEMRANSRFEVMGDVYRAELPAESKGTYWHELSGEREKEQPGS